MDKDGGRPPTDEELRELGIDPDENRDKRENPRPLPDVLTTGEELCRRHAASLEQLDRMFNRPPDVVEDTTPEQVDEAELEAEVTELEEELDEET